MYCLGACFGDPGGRQRRAGVGGVTQCPCEQIRRTFYWLAAVAAVPWEVVLWAAVLAGRLSSADLTPT